MKRYKLSKAILTIVMTLTMGFPILAHDFVVDGIYYNVIDEDNKKVEVTGTSSSITTNPSMYSGNIIIPNKVEHREIVYTITSIGPRAFYKSKVMSIVIPNTITDIGSEAFCDCTCLTSIDFGDSITTIGDFAFGGCTGLLELIIPNSVKEIKDNAFSFCGGLYSVEIGESVVSIGNYAFDNCSNLESIKIPNTVLKIGCGAFDDTHWLKKQPDGLLYLEDYCLGYKSLFNEKPKGELILKENTRVICDFAFSACNEITSVIIPNTVVAIGNEAFNGCSGLESIIIPESVNAIGDGAFSYCTSLGSIIIGNSVTSIGSHAFNFCHSLMSIMIPNSVIDIGYSAFNSCSKLEEISIGNSVNQIGDMAFDLCTNLKEVNISNLDCWCKIDFEGVTSNPLIYAHKLKINDIEIKDLVIPNNIVKIKNFAFMGCSTLTSITIPNSITSIGTYAFYDCGLSLVTSYCMTAPICGDATFGGYTNDSYSAKLMVPEGSIESYVNANEWKKFKINQEIAGVAGVEFGNNAVEVTRYDIYGRVLMEPTKGVNIVKMSDGTTRKEVEK